ncbi:MAG: hypothetical protein LAN36_06825 [Acidobacteriia bacterium]|nr:hypothetical protein [Terriglobia bacterium]
MLTLAIWWACILVEALVVFRAFPGNLLRKYPFFYTYAASVLVCDVLLYSAYTLSPARYPAWVWGTEFLNILLGCGIILEIFKHVLSSYAGAERFARITGVAVFAAIFCFGVLYPMAPGTSQAPSTSGLFGRSVRLERDLLAAQAILFFAVLVVISYFRTAMGKNVRGMILGYGVWLGASVMTLALRFYIGPGFTATLNVIQPVAYLTALLIWVVALWSYDPNPAFDSSAPVEIDHEAVVATTRSALEAMRSHLSKVARA